MKAKFLDSWKAVLVLAALPFVAASLQTPGSFSNAVAGENSDDYGDDVASVPIDPIAAGMDTNQMIFGTDMTNTANPGATNVFFGPGTDVAMKPSAATLPDLKLNGGTTEMVKLAQAGVGEDVMLSYVTNSTSRFGLGPDEIIYLNDLGVSGTVVQAMIQHDSALGASMTTNMVATMPPTQPEPIPDAGQPVPPPGTPSMTTPDYVDYTYPPVDTWNPQDTGQFYDSLAPYGSWVAVAGYGLCWQPTVYTRNHAWRPYLDRGRWLYSDCGWYWQSDYSWGWAAFHYGRWYCDSNRGWVWCPDRVWGPAWVSWRNSADYCGWAPLPPAARFQSGIGFTFHNHTVTQGFGFGLGSGLFAFIPTARMTDYSPYRYTVTGAQAKRVFNQATVVNNVLAVNNKVFNQGVNPSRVEAAGHVPVRRAVIQEATSRGDGRMLADRIEKRGNTLTVIRPSLPGTGRGDNHGGPASATVAGASGQVGTPRGAGTGALLTPAGSIPTVGTVSTQPVSTARTVTSPATSGTSDHKAHVEVYQRPDSTATTAPVGGARTVSSTATPGTTDHKPRVEVYQRPDAPVVAPAKNILLPNAAGTVTATSSPKTETYPPNSIVLMGPKNGISTAGASAGTSTRSAAQDIYRPNTSFTVQIPRSSVEPPAQSYAPVNNAVGRSTAPGQYSYSRLTGETPAAVQQGGNAPGFNQGQEQSQGRNGFNRNFGEVPAVQGGNRSTPVQSQAPILVPTRQGGGQSSAVYSAPAYQPPPAPVHQQQSAPVLVPQAAVHSSPPPAQPAPSQSSSSQASSQSSSQSQSGKR